MGSKTFVGSLIVGALVFAVAAVQLFRIQINRKEKKDELYVQIEITQIQAFHEYLVRFKKLCREFPVSLDVLVGETAAGAGCPKVPGLRIENVSDAWGNKLIYSNSETEVKIMSLGRDGEPGGEGPDKDISSEIKK